MSYLEILATVYVSLMAMWMSYNIWNHRKLSEIRNDYEMDLKTLKKNYQQASESSDHYLQELMVARKEIVDLERAAATR